MTRITLFFSALLIGIMAISCGKESAPLQCTGDCIFVIENASGTMTKMDCFDKFAIKAKHPETDSIFVYGIPDELDASYEQQGKQVTFSGVFRANSLTPSFPDPSFNPATIYQMRITKIK
jgi:hypothetical protein